MIVARRIVVTAVALILAVPLAARERPPTGRIAVSCGDRVVLVDPRTGAEVSLESGPVGWLYPAPGGLLFAPDTVHGRTTVVALATARVVHRLDGVTLPVFGEAADRYVVVVPGKVLVASFPERVVLAEHEVPLRRPWRARVSADGLFLYVLERPRHGGPASLAAVDLLRGELAGRRELGHDAVDMELLEELGVIAVTEPDAGVVELVSGSSLRPEARVPCAGAPVALAYDGRRSLWVAATRGDGGTLERWKLGRGRKGLTRHAKGELALPGRPLRLARDPSGPWLAVAAEDGALWIVPADLGGVARTVVLPAPPRDVVWPDLSRPGPLLPEWSDQGPAPWATPGARTP